MMISVIMSVYKELPEYIHQSVSSILNQTYQDFEFIIIVDNPENTDVISIINEYKKQDNRINLIINEKNIGLTASLNKALSLAQGRYIARMDADDISYHERLETQLQFIQHNNYDIVGSKTRLIDVRGNILSESRCIYDANALIKHLRISNCVAHPSWMVKADIYHYLNGYRDIKWCEDYDFLLRSIKAGFRIGMCPTVLLNYRINPSGISQTAPLKQFLTAHYLASNFKRIECLTMAEINKKVISSVTEKECDKFNRAKQLYVAASTYRPLKKCRYRLKALLTSKHYLLRCMTVARLHRIRSKYK